MKKTFILLNNFHYPHSSDSCFIFFINLNNFKNKKPVIQATIIQAAPKKIEQKKIEQKKIEKKQNKPAEKKSTKFPIRK